MKKHETMKVLPPSKTAQIRSIQEHGDDAEFAVTGGRVGLALENIESKDLDRGFILTTGPSLQYAQPSPGKPSW